MLFIVLSVSENPVFLSSRISSLLCFQHTVWEMGSLLLSVHYFAIIFLMSILDVDFVSI